jgi:hypothetical protein
MSARRPRRGQRPARRPQRAADFFGMEMDSDGRGFQALDLASGGIDAPAKPVQPRALAKDG